MSKQSTQSLFVGAAFTSFQLQKIANSSLKWFGSPCNHLLRNGTQEDSPSLCCLSLPQPRDRVLTAAPWVPSVRLVASSTNPLEHHHDGVCLTEMFADMCSPTWPRFHREGKNSTRPASTVGGKDKAATLGTNQGTKGQYSGTDTCRIALNANIFWRGNPSVSCERALRNDMATRLGRTYCLQMKPHANQLTNKSAPTKKNTKKMIPVHAAVLSARDVHSSYLHLTSLQFIATHIRRATNCRIVGSIANLLQAQCLPGVRT